MEPEFLKNVPNINETSRDWRIERNRLVQNKKAIRIAADQNHGIYPLSQEKSAIPPHHHVIQNNDIRGNVIGIELENTKDTQKAGNRLENLVTNVDER